MRMQRSKRCLLRMPIIGNRCKRTCLCKSAISRRKVQADPSQSRGSGGNRGRGRPPGVGGPPRGGPGAGKFDYSMPTDKEPPTGYICYRCGQKGTRPKKRKELTNRPLDPGLPK